MENSQDYDDFGDTSSFDPLWPYDKEFLESTGFPNEDNQSNYDSQLYPNDEQFDMHQIFPLINPYPQTLGGFSNTNSNNLHDDNQKSKSGTNPKNQKPRQKKKREKVILSDWAIVFKKKYKDLFHRGKINKEQILDIQKILENKPDLKIHHISRASSRNIDKYFEEYACYGQIIIGAVRQLIEDKIIDRKGFRCVITSLKKSGV